MRLKPLRRAAVLSAAALLALATPAAAEAPYAPLPPHNPYAGPDGTATMHGDTASSDTTPLPVPGPAP